MHQILKRKEGGFPLGKREEYTIDVLVATPDHAYIRLIRPFHLMHQIFKRKEGGWVVVPNPTREKGRIHHRCFGGHTGSCIHSFYFVFPIKAAYTLEKEGGWVVVVPNLALGIIHGRVPHRKKAAR